MERKKMLEMPKTEIILFDAEDIIITSTETESNVTGVESFD